ncbi:MAG: Holliday junction resolvase RuvX [Pseudomonadota bacterium]
MMALTIDAFCDLKGALLGLDLGVKTIGVAVTDPGQTLATPVTTIKRIKFGKDADALIALADERGIVGLVLGLPLNMDGSDGPKVQSVKTFAKNLSRKTDLPIALWDERLSTAAAERALIDLDVSRSRRAAVIDSHAASYILEGAVDRLAKLRRGASA